MNEESVLDTLKPEINNFCFSKMPGNMTLEEFEEATIEIYKVIAKAWENKRES